MNKGLDLMNEIRERQLTRGIRYAAVLGILPLIFSVSRAYYAGWHSVMSLQIVFYCLIMVTAIFSRSLPFIVKASIIVAITYILGLSSLISWGLLAFGVTTLFLFCILSTMLFGTRAGIISASISTLTIAVVGFANVNGKRP